MINPHRIQVLLKKEIMAEVQPQLDELNKRIDELTAEQGVRDDKGAKTEKEASAAKNKGVKGNKATSVKGKKQTKA